MNKAFSTHVDKEIDHDGFHMTFANGCTISVMFGKFSYGDQGQTTAEVAAWNSNGDWMFWNGDNWVVLTDGATDIMSYQTADEVANLIYSLKSI